MSDDMVKRAREALDGVTDGPWELHSDPCHYDTVSEIRGGEQGKGRAQLPRQLMVSVGGYAGWREQEANTSFIAASRDLVPAMADRIEALTAERDALAEKLEAWLEVAANCTIEEGVCCCGDDMTTHSEPMNCGHSPVDHGAYVVMQLAEDTRATLAEITGGKTDDHTD